MANTFSTQWLKGGDQMSTHLRFLQIRSFYGFNFTTHVTEETIVRDPLLLTQEGEVKTPCVGTVAVSGVWYSEFPGSILGLSSHPSSAEFRSEQNTDGKERY